MADTVAVPAAPYVPPVRDETGRARSMAMVSRKLRLFNGEEEYDFPVPRSCKVGDVKAFVAEQAMTETDKIDFYCKSGPYMVKFKDHEQMPPVSLVKGIKSFQPIKMKWPHPIGIIGQGYHGLKTAMTYVMDGNQNFVCFDRNDIFGGYCWITGANKTSRLQTEFGSFHIWWGPQNIDVFGDKSNDLGLDYPDCNTDVDPHDGSVKDKYAWHIWPYKAQMQRHFQVAAERYGIRPHVHFKCNVGKMDIVGDKTAEDRYYKLYVENLDGGAAPPEVPCSVIYNYPGSLTQNRIIEYPGEDEFDGFIRYGMNDDTPYEALKGSTTAILGNGAFAVENCRTTIECGGLQTYVVTRRKNLASPRLPCWFVHQGPVPTPGRMILDMFGPMYDLVNFGDPWKFWSVHTNEARTNVTILQNSRFGIGDVTFLMVAWGLLIFTEGVVKRMSHHTLHISNGDKLENVTIVLKALGLLGDWSVDKLHNMKEMKGPFCQGDWRRTLMIDATGMNAANFTTFSTGIGTTDFVLTMKYLHDFPKKAYQILDQGFIKNLPSHKEEPEIEKPAYVTDVKYSMTAGIILDGMVPQIGNMPLRARASEFKYTMYHRTHGTDRALQVVNREWDTLQKEWKERGFVHDYVPYPYTKEVIKGWFDEYNKALKFDQAGPQFCTRVEGHQPGEWTMPGM